MTYLGMILLAVVLRNIGNPQAALAGLIVFVLAVWQARVTVAEKMEVFKI